MEWEAPGIVLGGRPLNESDVVAVVFAREHGRVAGLARGGSSRKGAATWQQGNLIQARWVGRLPEQLGNFSAELVHPAAALVLDDALALAMLTAVCAVADGALPDREPHPAVFDGLLHLIAHLATGEALLPDLVRWEAAVLGELGFGLDLSMCAVTGQREDLVWVSPRTGRAVSEAGAGAWRGRLLPLPPFLLGQNPSHPAEWRDGLRLTGHFLGRDLFGATHRPLPLARQALYDRVAKLADEV